MKTPNRINVLLSGGGLDSAAFIMLERDRLDYVVHIDYGQQMAKQEWEATVRLVESVDPTIEAVQLTLDHTVLGGANPASLLMGTGDDPYVRGRNMTLLKRVVDHFVEHVMVQGLEAYITVNLGLCKENMMFDDANPRFVHLINEVISLSYGNSLVPYNPTSHRFHPLVQIKAPYIGTPKTQFMADAVNELGEHGFDILFNRSFTCWTPVNHAECGECYHCTKKAKLMEELQAA